MGTGRKVVSASLKPGVARLRFAWLKKLSFTVLLCIATAPALAQFFPTDQPMRRGRQPSFGMMGFPPMMQSQGSPLGGFGAPPPQQRPQSGVNRFPFHPRVARRPPPRIDYSHAPAAEKPDVVPDRNVLVLGDAMADWLGFGLEEVFGDQPELGVIRKYNSESGLIKYPSKRGEPSDWVASAKAIVAAEKTDAVVVMLGWYDRIPIQEAKPETSSPPTIRTREPSVSPAENEAADDDADALPAAAAGAVVHPPDGDNEFRSARWVQLYTRKVRQMIAALKSKGAPVIWVGLPAFRGQQATSDALFLNALYRDIAAKAGITYVDVWDGFVDEAGRFVQYGPDFEGQTRRLRSADGVFFTRPGARKLAHYVDREIKRLLATRAAPSVLPSEPSPILPEGGRDKTLSRPLAGPVVPLVAPAVDTTALLGGAGTKAGAVDALVTRTLAKGEPLAAPAGRADDYRWPRREFGQSDPPMASSSAVQMAEPLTTGEVRLRASRTDQP